MNDPLRQRAQAALEDPVLQRALPPATKRAVEKQAARWAELPDVEALRQQAKAVKDHTLANLDHYLETFAANAEAAGHTIHWAATHEEARAIVTDLLRSIDAKLVVKAKSLTTEELQLNQHLADTDITPIETDLGEFIVQLKAQRPSHLTAPAIHEDTESIAALFTAKLGVPRTHDAEILSRAAREHLRSRFASADAGITGANFLLADTGQLVLVENEGNIRLATSKPRMHIAVAGIEKVIPSTQHLPIFLELLARSATGQKLTSYTQVLSGSDDVERHIVLVDAGRSGILAESRERAMLGCIRCGACLNTCPVYRTVGGHAYGSTYPGPIGAVLTPWLEPSTDAARLPYASTLCGACEAACPVLIPIPELLLRGRRRAVAEGADPSPTRRALERRLIAAWRRTNLDAKRFERAVRLAAVAARPLATRGRIRRLPPPLSGWTRHRTFPAPNGRTYHARRRVK